MRPRTGSLTSEHNEEILRDVLGYSNERIEALRTNGLLRSEWR